MQAMVRSVADTAEPRSISTMYIVSFLLLAFIVETVPLFVNLHPHNRGVKLMMNIFYTKKAAKSSTQGKNNLPLN